ncbi:MAG: endolytic transglycosylase MltG [Polyangiaceae bacterium]|nr:endolytic transglycosylase MltG [Polyangiaceae bacterium]
MVLVLLASLAAGGTVASMRWPGPGTGRRVVLDWTATLGPFAGGRRLLEAGILRSTPPFLVAYWLAGGRQQIASGEHVVDDRMSPQEIVRTLTRSPSRPTRRVVLPEGLHHLQIADRMEQQGICTAHAFRSAVRGPVVLDELKIVGGTAEGYLFPATYDLLANTPAEEVLRRLVHETRSRLQRLRARHPDGYAARVRELGDGERAILTLASIVEREAQVAEERPRIARVYLNRLADQGFVPRGRLQSDPTAGYGCLVEPELESCRGYVGRITPAMLRDPGNPYNTYRHSGLPPSPIANPGEPAIEAVLAPAAGDDLFFVAIGGGRHRFTRTFSDHRRAIESDRP